jgi:peptidyl-prolyl cis-trans isomerase B (cyclophilin B)
MKFLTLLALVAVIATACDSTAAAPPPRRTTPRPPQTSFTAPGNPTPTPICAAAPSQPSNIATITMENGGVIVILLRPDKAPKTVSNFAFRANKFLYDGLTFHRVVADFVVQGGDPFSSIGNPNGNKVGEGGGDQCTELSDLPFDRYAVGTPRRPTPIEISNGSQFFICIRAVGCHDLDGQYTNFGLVVKGQDVVDSIKIGDRIKTITVK